MGKGGLGLVKGKFVHLSVHERQNRTVALDFAQVWQDALRGHRIFSRKKQMQMLLSKNELQNPRTRRTRRVFVWYRSCLQI